MNMMTPKKRLNHVDFARASVLKELRDVAYATTIGTSVSIEVKGDPTNQRFRVIAIDCNTAVRLEHPIPWYVPRSLMILECASLVKAVQVESAVVTSKPAAAKKPWGF